jgi:pilus assembly protein CpaB
MRGRTVFFVALALVLGAAAMLPKGWTGYRSVHCEYDLLPVVVASSALPAGAVLTFEMISQRSALPQAVSRSNVTPDLAGDLIGKRLKVALLPGDPLRWEDLETVERLPALMKKARAVTIDVDAHRAVDGRLEASNHVDVLVTVKDPQTGELTTVTMTQNVVVLGVTHRAPPALESFSLLVLPQEAELMIAAQDLGRFSLTLRNPDDVDFEEEGSRATLNTLLSGERRRLAGCTHHRTLMDIRGSAR